MMIWVLSGALVAELLQNQKLCAAQTGETNFVKSSSCFVCKDTGAWAKPNLFRSRTNTDTTTHPSASTTIYTIIFVRPT